MVTDALAHTQKGPMRTYIAEGKTDREIAALMRLPVLAVKEMRKFLTQKMGREATED